MAKARRFGKAEVEVSIRDRVGAGLAAIERRFRAFGAGLQAVGTLLSVVGAGFTAAFGALGASLAFPTKLAADLEQTTVAFETLLGSAEKAGVLLGRLRDFAASTPLAFNDIANAARNLVAFGFAAEQVETELRRVGDIASGIGQPIGEIAEIYGKARVQGRLFGEDVNQLTGRGIPVIQEFAKQLGVAESEVKKMVADGKISFPNLQRAFADLTSEGGKFGGMMEKQSKTLTGLISTLKDNVFNALVPIGEAVSDLIKPIVTQMIELINPIAAFIKKNAAIAKVFVIITAAGFALGAAITAIGAAMVVTAIAIASITTIFGALGAAISIIASPAGILVSVFAALGILTLNLTGGIDQLGYAVWMLGDAAKQAWSGIVAAVGSGDLALAGQIAFAALEVGWLTLTVKMKEIWLQVTDYFYNLWLNVVESIVNAGTQIYFSLAKTFDQLGNAMAAGFDIGLTYIMGAIDSIQTGIAKLINETLKFFRLLDAETADGANQILDDEFNKRAAQRQGGLDSRAQARGDSLAARAAARRANRDGFLSTVAQDFAARRRNSGTDRSGLEAAQIRLAELQSRAIREAQGNGSSGPGAAKAASKLAAAGVQSSDVKAVGSSSAAAIAAGALGANRPANETAQNTRKTAALLQRIARRRGGFA